MPRRGLAEKILEAGLAGRKAAFAKVGARSESAGVPDRNNLPFSNEGISIQGRPLASSWSALGIIAAVHTRMMKARRSRGRFLLRFLTVGTGW